MDEAREEGEDRKDVDLPDGEVLLGVAHLPVAELMSKHGDDLLLLGLIDEGVVEDDFLAHAGEAGEVRVGVGAALGAVDDLQLRKGEVEFSSKGFDSAAERPFGKGGEFVEDWDDDRGVDGDGEDLDDEHEEVDVVEELVAGLLDDGEEGRAEGEANDDAERLGFEEVGHPQLERLLVEAEFLFKHKVVVVVEGEAYHGGREAVDEDPD